MPASAELSSNAARPTDRYVEEEAHTHARTYVLPYVVQTYEQKYARAPPHKHISLLFPKSRRISL